MTVPTVSQTGMPAGATTAVLVAWDDAAGAWKPVQVNADGRMSIAATIDDISMGEYETVAAGQTDQAIGAAGAVGDYLAGLLVVPATTSPGGVSIKDGGGSAITVFQGGASSVASLVPFFVPLGIRSGAGAWEVTTGANISVVAVGNFR